MINTYKEVLEGGYVALNVSKKSSLDIMEVFNGYQIEDNFHMTMIYDESEPTGIYRKSDAVYIADTVDIGVLGGALVIFLQKEPFVSRYEELLSYGFNHSFDDILPHVTIIYEPSETDIETIVGDKTAFLGKISTITLTDEYSEHINK